MRRVSFASANSQEGNSCSYDCDPFFSILSSAEEFKWEITRSAALHPEAIALPTDNPPLWLPEDFIIHPRIRIRIGIRIQ
jgi:hypothetical protein